MEGGRRDGGWKEGWREGSKGVKKGKERGKKGDKYVAPKDGTRKMGHF